MEYAERGRSEGGPRVGSSGSCPPRGMKVCGLRDDLVNEMTGRSSRETRDFYHLFNHRALINVAGINDLQEEEQGRSRAGRWPHLPRRPPRQRGRIRQIWVRGRRKWKKSLRPRAEGKSVTFSSAFRRKRGGKSAFQGPLPDGAVSRRQNEPWNRKIRLGLWRRRPPNFRTKRQWNWRWELVPLLTVR